MTAQHTHARKLLKVIRDRIENGEQPISGYSNAATLIGLKGEDYARAFGQVCSRIDAASFMAGWPLLALNMVRRPNGEINTQSLSPDWGPWNDEFRSLAESHSWTVQQVDDVIGALDGLSKEGAGAIWDGYLKAETERPGFIRFNLHRKLRTPK